METSRSCKRCKKKRVIRVESGALVCESCGVEQEFDNFQAHFDPSQGPQGTFVRIGSSTTNNTYKENKLYHADLNIEEITSRLGFSSARAVEVKKMAEEITEGEFGEGNWFPIFIGACCYVVMRKNNLPYSMSEVAVGIGCDLHELGRMVIRIVDFLSLVLPEFDIVKSFEQSIRTYPKFSEISREKLDTVIKQGRLLLNCAIKWFLTTGRQPIPVVVAVMVFVAELNEVEVCIEDVAKSLYAGVLTCRKRSKELRETLVKVAQALPWGKNVTVKNIVKNAPFVMKYMEMKCMLTPSEKKSFFDTGGFDLGEIVTQCLQEEAEYSMDDYSPRNDYQLSVDENGDRIVGSASFDDLENVKVSQERLSDIYMKFLTDSDFPNSVEERGEHRKKRMKDLGLQVCKTLWTGESDLSRKLFYNEILEKNVGYNGLPPSFIAGQLACKRRREKIKAAKRRIDEIMQPPSSVIGDKNNMTSLVCVQNKRKGKRKAKFVDIDWEDWIIETLLLHHVKEDEIEQGHYKRLLDLYVFDSEGACEIFKGKKIK